MTYVWAAFHRAHRSFNDVAVAANRSTDPDEWKRAHYDALRNMHRCQQEAQRWGRIADEMAGGMFKTLRVGEGQPEDAGPGKTAG